MCHQRSNELGWRKRRLASGLAKVPRQKTPIQSSLMPRVRAVRGPCQFGTEGSLSASWATDDQRPTGLRCGPLFQTMGQFHERPLATKESLLLYHRRCHLPSYFSFLYRVRSLFDLLVLLNRKPPYVGSAMIPLREDKFQLLRERDSNILQALPVLPVRGASLLFFSTTCSFPHGCVFIDQRNNKIRTRVRRHINSILTASLASVVVSERKTLSKAVLLCVNFSIYVSTYNRLIPSAYSLYFYSDSNRFEHRDISTFSFIFFGSRSRREFANQVEISRRAARSSPDDGTYVRAPGGSEASSDSIQSSHRLVLPGRRCLSSRCILSESVLSFYDGDGDYGGLVLRPVSSRDCCALPFAFLASSFLLDDRRALLLKEEGDKYRCWIDL